MSKILIHCAFLACLFAASLPAAAALNCPDITGEKHIEQMEELAIEIHLQDDYFTRYDEDVVYALCRGEEGSIEEYIDNGSADPVEVEKMRKALGLTKRSKVGQSYGYSRAKFQDMGLCRTTKWCQGQLTHMQASLLAEENGVRDN